MNSIKLVASLVALVCFSSCKQKEDVVTVLVKNTLDFERASETVALSKSDLKIENIASIGIRNAETGQLQITQLVDNDGDGTMDDILFQPKIKANAEVAFEVVKVAEAEQPKAPELCYSRFVPERTDDYAWENNKVAFRIFGPTAQKMVEENTPGGTLSSGVDAWLKRVEHPIINSWYKKETETDGTYHEDTGEGLDNFHVGVSRGVGGIAVKVDTTYYFSKNYTKWRTITNGPLRTSFYVEYENWDVAGKSISESRIISLDLGSHLSRFDISIDGTDKISAGLTLHEKDGVVSANEKNGWVSYWQPHGESELGTGIVVPQETFLGYEKYDVAAKDLSNAYAHLKVKNSKAVYYVGFAWEAQGDFKTKDAWEDYLNTFSLQINNPLVVSID